MCQYILAEKIWQSTFAIKPCTSLMYNVCRVISRVTKIALLNKFRNES